MNNVAVLGAGSWGSTLSWMLANAGRNVRLWTQDAAKAERINATHVIERPLKIEIPHQVVASSNLGESVADADVIPLPVVVDIDELPQQPSRGACDNGRRERTASRI